MKVAVVVLALVVVVAADVDTYKPVYQEKAYTKPNYKEQDYSVSFCYSQ